MRFKESCRAWLVLETPRSRRFAYPEHVDRERREFLAILDAARRELRALGPVKLDPWFLAAVERFQDAECNREGRDKSWVLRCVEANRRFFRSVSGPFSSNP